MGLLRRPVLVKIMTIKLHYKSVLIPLRKILWTCCIFLSSLNNTFFSALVIIFRNMSYFCFNYTNTLFIHTMNYFSVVLRIIFLMWIKNYFLIGPRIIFQGIANLFFGLQCITGLSFEVDWSLTSLGDHFGNFASKGVPSKRIPRRNIVRERNERGFHLPYKICQELLVCRQWWGFLDRRFNRGDYEWTPGTSRIVHFRAEKRNEHAWIFLPRSPGRVWKNGGIQKYVIA